MPLSLVDLTAALNVLLEVLADPQDYAERYKDAPPHWRKEEPDKWEPGQPWGASATTLIQAAVNRVLYRLAGDSAFYRDGTPSRAIEGAEISGGLKAELEDLRSRLQDQWLGLLALPKYASQRRAQWVELKRIAALLNDHAKAAHGGPPPARVRCDESERAVYLDGEIIAPDVPLNPFRFFAAVAAAHPDPITIKKIQGNTKTLYGKNATRDLRDKLPQPLLPLIASGKNGYSLKLPPRKL